MKIKSSIVALFLICIFTYNAYSQPDCITDPPLPPILGLVSVQPETGNTEISWTLSQSPGIVAYVVYSYINGDGMPVDTLWDPQVTNYLFTGTVSKYRSASYVVSSMRLPRCTSILSNELSTIYTEVKVDTCSNKIVINWNRYLSYPKEVNDYSILLSVNGDSFYEIAKVSSLDSTYNLNEFTTNDEYCFIVRANLEGEMHSTSNKICVSTKMQRPPRWINADYATVNEENKISLSFSIDPLSEITRFKLEKKEELSGNFIEIAKPVSINNSVLYTDNIADINKRNFYRLSAINNCDSVIALSNLASNMVLALEREDDDLILSWNRYENWLGEISEFRLFINTGNSFEERNVILATDSTLTFSYREIMYEVSGSEVCFYVTASETMNPFGINSLSRSSEKCTTPNEIITVPTVFTPNNDLLNDLFKPVISFTPKDYHLVITNRHGRTLFDTNDHTAAWDGSMNGKSQPQDVYLWFLQATAPSGKIISKTGTITIFDNRE